LASGVGYAIWYTALRGLKAISAATVRLSVPIVTAVGGIAIALLDLTRIHIPITSFCLRCAAAHQSQGAV